jgi:hypothetical protein
MGQAVCLARIAGTIRGVPNEDSRRNALKAIFVQHNNWPDIEDETKLLEQPSEDAFWNKIPNELLGILIAGLNLEVSRIPKLMVQNANK